MTIFKHIPCPMYKMSILCLFKLSRNCYKRVPYPGEIKSMYCISKTVGCLLCVFQQLSKQYTTYNVYCIQDLCIKKCIVHSKPSYTETLESTTKNSDITGKYLKKCMPQT